MESPRKPQKPTCVCVCVCVCVWRFSFTVGAPEHHDSVLYMRNNHVVQLDLYSVCTTPKIVVFCVIFGLFNIYFFVFCLCSLFCFVLFFAFDFVWFWFQFCFVLFCLLLFCLVFCLVWFWDDLGITWPVSEFYPLHLICPFSWLFMPTGPSDSISAEFVICTNLIWSHTFLFFYLCADFWSKGTTNPSAVVCREMYCSPTGQCFSAIVSEKVICYRSIVCITVWISLSPDGAPWEHGGHDCQAVRVWQRWHVPLFVTPLQ